MILLRRILPFLSPVILAALLIGLLLQVQTWQLLTAWILALVIATHIYILQWRVFTAEFWWSLLPALCWTIAGLGFFVFVASPVYQWTLIFVISIVYGVYTENIFTFHFQPQKYTPLSLPKLSYYMMIVSTLFLFSFLFALDLINSIPFWVALCVAPVYAWLTVALVFRGYSVLERKHFGMIFATGVAALEATWIIQFFPTSYMVAGSLLALLIYCAPSILLMIARDAFDKTAALQYGAVAILATAAILFTAQWV